MEEESGEKTGQPPLVGKICQDNKLMMMIITVFSIPHVFIGITVGLLLTHIWLYNKMDKVYYGTIEVTRCITAQ